MLKSIKSSNLVINNAVQMQEEITTESNGKGRKFVSRFIEAGLAHYEQFGDVLITKETLDKFVHTLIGCPVIIKHKDITDKNADQERVGVISNVWFNDFDGWFYCDGIIWNKQAIDLVKNQGWNVSCTYDFESDFVKGTYHGKSYDMEFTGGKFLHLALVPNPRYERATIVMNSKDKEYQMLIENKDDENGRWVTIKGTHVFIPDGKQIEDVMREKGWITEGKTSKKSSKEKDLEGKYSRDDVEFDEEQAKKDIAAARKLGHKDIDDVAEFLGLDPEEVIELTGEGYDDIDDELVQLDVADKPTEEAQKAIDRDRNRWQREAEERQKVREKEKDIDLSKLKLDKPKGKGEKEFKSEESQYSEGRLKGEIRSLEDEIDDIDDELQGLDDKLKKSEKAIDKYTRDKAKGYKEEIQTLETKRKEKEAQLDKLYKEQENKKEQKGKEKSKDKGKGEEKKGSDFEKKASRYPDTPDELEQIKSSINKYFKSDANDKSVSVKELNKTFSLHQYNVDDIIDAAKEAGYEVKDDVIYRKGEGQGEGKGEEGKKTAKGNKPVDISKFQFKNYKNPEGQNRKGYETYKSSFESISKETEHVPEKVKKQYNGNTPPYKAARTEFSHINDNASARDLMDGWTNRNKDYKPVIDAILERQNAILEELKPYNKWNGKEWVKSADNSIQNGFSERIQNSLVEVIADAICDEVCNNTDFFV